jgi:hypothetical protein
MKGADRREPCVLPEWLIFRTVEEEHRRGHAFNFQKLIPPSYHVTGRELTRSCRYNPSYINRFTSKPLYEERNQNPEVYS